MSTFQAALARLGELHSQDLDHVRQEYEQQIATLSQENASLRSRTAETEATRPAGMELQVAKEIHDDAGEKHAPDPLIHCSPDALQLESIAPHVPGDFAVKDVWNKTIETRRWGSNLDAYMFSTGIWKSNGEDVIKGILRWRRPSLGSSHSSLTRRCEVARVAAQGLVDPQDKSSGGRDEAALSELPEATGCTIYPNSTGRMAWDVAGLLLIAYDLVMIPFSLAFDPPDFWLLVGMDWLTLCFWSGDMIQGFFLGYFEKGHYVSSNRKILRHYMLTWFLPDAIVVVPDWFVSIAGLAANTTSETEQAGEMFKFLKGARALRVLRLLRLLKLQRIVNMLYDMIESEHTFICVGLIRLLLAVMILNHVIACIWFLIGRTCMERGVRNWIEVGNVKGEGIGYQYSTSLHWSLTQFTPASMDVSARNVPERVFSIVVLFFSVVAFSSIIASITGAMTSLRNMRAEEMKQFWLLRRYFRQRKITSDLGDRVFKYLAHQAAQTSKLVQASSLKGTLPKLSLALQSELAYELCCRFLVQHPFFEYLDSSMAVVMHRLCHVCLSTQSHAEREIIFNPGDKASKMLFIKGKHALLNYTTVDGLRLEPPPRQEDWVGEAVLWTTWRHAGRLQTVTATDLIALDPAQFVEILGIHPRSWFYAKRYAAKFVEWLNCMEPGDVIDILRDSVWYFRAARACDEYLSEEPVSHDNGEGHGSNSGSEDEQGSTRPDDDVPTGFKGLYRDPAPRGPPARPRGLGICQWVASAACEPWCSPAPQRS